MPIDAEKRAALLQKVEALEPGDEQEHPVVPLAEFLDGNDDDGSFAVNAGHALQRWRSRFTKITDHPDVHAVYAAIVDDMEGDEESWPYADTLLVYTKAPAEIVSAWFGPMAPDEVDELGDASAFPGAPPPPPGYRVVRCWWD
jgi:hypothetical protein